MPNIAQFHPQIVHFVVALLFVGVAFRIVSLTPWFKFTNHAATTLLLIGTVASVLAVRSGTEAHGPVERIPGVRDAVVEHEEKGEWARNMFLGVAALELIAFGLSQKQDMTRYARYAQFASAIVGLLGSAALYEAAEHGGELVYSYAGGPGLRSGDSKDVARLLMAGLYNQSRVDRREKRPADAAALVNEMAKRAPGDTNVRFLKVESLVFDAKDYPGALALIDSIGVSPKDARFGARAAMFRSDAYVALGKPDSARAVLSSAIATFPQNARLKAKLDSIK